MAALTEKQRRFVLSWMKNANATQAAKEAGYSEATARTQGGQLMKTPAVRAAIIRETQKLIAQEIAEAKEIMIFLTSCMRGEVYEEEPVIEGKGNGHSEMRMVKKQISARERLKAAELLMKRFGLMQPETEKSEGITFVFSRGGHEIIKDGETEIIDDIA